MGQHKYNPNCQLAAEVNRHHILRAKDTFKRSPQYCSTDYNYARFNVICTGGYMQWEMVDGELREYES